MIELASKFDERLPLLIRFAVKTALRRERILEFQPNFVRDIGNGQKAIRFPPDGVRRKKAGVIPVTREIAAIISEAAKLGSSAENAPLFDIKSDALDDWWRRLLKLANIVNLHFHDLRHEATSQLFESGLTVAEVMSITGHSTTEMVERYSHYSAALVLKKLEEGLDPENLLAQIKFLARQFLGSGGAIDRLIATLDNIKEGPA